MTELTRRAALAGVAATTLMPLAAATPVRAAAPLADKQNASFYRYNVGTHQITVVCDGVATVNLSDNYATGATKEEIGKVLAEHHLPADKMTHSFNPVVVNTGPKLVVIDTGLGPGPVCAKQGQNRTVPFQPRRGKHRPQHRGHRDHFPLPWRPHQRSSGRRKQACLRKRRDHGAGCRVEVLDGRRRDEQGNGKSHP